MAEGQTDEGGAVNSTDCFLIQHPLIRPSGPPSPLRGKVLRADDIRPYTNLRRGAVGAIRGPWESAQRFSGERRGKGTK